MKRCGLFSFAKISLFMLSFSVLSCANWVGLDQNVINIQALQRLKSGGDDKCVMKIDDPTMGSGFYDLTNSGQYRIRGVVSSQLFLAKGTQGAANANKGDYSYPNYGKEDPNYVFLETVKVSFRDGDTGKAIPSLPFPEQDFLSTTGTVGERETPIGEILNSRKTNALSMSGFSFPLIGEEDSIKLNAVYGEELTPGATKDIIVDMVVLGTTGSGTKVYTQTYSFWVKICVGCMPVQRCAIGYEPDPEKCSVPGQDGGLQCIKIKEQ